MTEPSIKHFAFIMLHLILQLSEAVAGSWSSYLPACSLPLHPLSQKTAIVFLLCLEFFCRSVTENKIQLPTSLALSGPFLSHCHVTPSLFSFCSTHTDLLSVHEHQACSHLTAPALAVPSDGNIVTFCLPRSAPLDHLMSAQMALSQRGLPQPHCLKKPPSIVYRPITTFYSPHSPVDLKAVYPFYLQPIFSTGMNAACLCA